MSLIDGLSRHAMWTRALEARDPRFDGVFFVGMTSTMIYCRPVCPARVSHPEYRRFFESAASAEEAGFRPCLRCRPELAPGRAVCDAVSRLAGMAALRIAAGALCGRSVPDLARELGVSERHLRRALKRELGVTPVALAQTHRLLLAKQLIADTSLSITRIAYASGFQSLRRFNAAFRERYRLSPSDLRRPSGAVSPEGDFVRLTLAYRPPLAWRALLDMLAREALPRVEVVSDGVYARTVRLERRTGVVTVRLPEHGDRSTHLVVDFSTRLVPALMPLLAGLRRLFDLDAQPTVVDEHLAESGLRDLVEGRPGLRLPGALDGFEVVLAVLLGGSAGAVVAALGEPAKLAWPGLDRHVPTAARVADAGVDGLAELGVPRQCAGLLATTARALVDGRLDLSADGDPLGTRRALRDLTGMADGPATRIVMRALHWPDAFPEDDAAIRGGTGVAARRDILRRAEQWRPWRAYAALHMQ